MNIIILMAGDSKRFHGSKYGDYKPFVEVKGKTILKWTVDSIPELQHLEIVVAYRTDHNEKYDVVERCKKELSPNLNFKSFEKLTEGNLQTAYESFNYCSFKNEPLLILDSDNHFDGGDLITYYMEQKTHLDNFASICYFEPKDDSSKWCFAMMSDSVVTELKEKDPQALKMGGKPMVGVFFFSNGELFYNVAKKILENKTKVASEYYMSQSISELIKSGIPVFGREVKNVIPMGTPEDLDKFLNNV